jgi:hypothetical protein
VQILDRQLYLQRFYECRLASLERYLAFCVMFHAMAQTAHAPWFCKSWEIARSQSNLRVATTAAPISASDVSLDDTKLSAEVFFHLRKVADGMRGYVTYF